MLSKINSNLKRLYKQYRQDLSFSARLANSRLFEEAANRLEMKRAAVFRYQKENEIRNYLDSKFSGKNADDNLENVATLNHKVKKDQTIWICWWDGERSAPPLVKACIKSIRVNANQHPVVMIDKNNYHRYITVPESVKKAFEDGKFGIAHLTDYIRFSLLRHYGGLWLDSTILLTNQIPDSYFENPIFSITKQVKSDPSVSQYRWTTFCFGGKANNLLFSLICKLIEEYWRDEEKPIDYLLTDYIIDHCYRKYDFVQKMIDLIPSTNEDIDELRNALNKNLSLTQVEEQLNRETILYKLSWREKYNFSQPGSNQLFLELTKYGSDSK